MLTLERGRGWSIYSLGGKEVHGLQPFTVRRQAEPDVRASCRMSGPTGGAGCPGWGPDVRPDGESFCRFWCVAPDFRASGRMSGLGPDVRGLQMLGDWDVAVVDVSSGRMSRAGAGCPGPGAVFFSFRRFSSSVNLVACPSSRASSGGSS